MLNWLKGLFGGKKADEGQSAPAAPITPAAPAQDMTGGNEESAPQVSEEVK
jgi:hypothetical protein